MQPEPDRTPRAHAALRFPKAARLTQTSEFRRVKEQGASVHGRLMVLGVLKIAEAGTDAEPVRLGFITSRRVGGAVVRNRVRRRLRELARASRPQIRPGHWIVIIARANAARADFAALKKEWLALARRAGVLDPARDAA